MNHVFAMCNVYIVMIYIYFSTTMDNSPCRVSTL